MKRSLAISLLFTMGIYAQRPAASGSGGGSGGGSGLGTVTSVATGCGMIGGTITVTGTLSNTGPCPSASVAGTADAITAVYSPVRASLFSGEMLSFTPSGNNTVTAPTFTPDSQTTHTIVKAGAAALAAGDIVANVQAILKYDVTGTRWELQNPQTVSSGSGYVAIQNNAGTTICGAGTPALRMQTGTSITTSVTDLGGNVCGVQQAVGVLANGQGYLGSILGPALTANTGAGLSVTGTSLTAGKVYYNGASGLALAKADALSTAGAYCLAISTTECAYTGAYQFSATQSWTAGQTIYVSAATAGLLVTTAPSTAGQFVAQVGFATAVGTLDIVPGIPVPAGVSSGLIRNYGAAFFNGGSALTTGISGTITIPMACTISGWDVSIPATDSGTATVKFLRLAAGTASPGSGNAINTSGVQLTTGTHVHSTTVTDFTSTAVAAFDVFSVDITAVGTAVGPLTANLECTQ